MDCSTEPTGPAQGHDHRQDVVLPGGPVSAPGVQPTQRGRQAGLTGGIEVNRPGLLDQQGGMAAGVALGPVVAFRWADGRLDHRHRLRVRRRSRVNNSE